MDRSIDLAVQHIDMVIFENIDIDIDIDKAILKNIDIDIDIDKEILVNIDIDIDKEVLENIDIDNEILENIYISLLFKINCAKSDHF